MLETAAERSDAARIKMNGCLSFCHGNLSAHQKHQFPFILDCASLMFSFSFKEKEASYDISLQTHSKVHWNIYS